jgi:16S rRNA processing protein RimM
VADYGGGDVIAVAGPDGERMFSFTRATVPLVDVAGGRLVVLPPDEIGPEQSEGEIGADKREGEQR